MNNNRRKFIKNSILLGLGAGFVSNFEVKAFSKNEGKNSNNFCKKMEKHIKIKGKMLTHEQLPLVNAKIKVCHDNLKADETNFQTYGELQTDEYGNYSFLTDFPERYFEGGFSKMRRIFMTIHEGDKEFSTTLYFGECGEPFIDSTHFHQTALVFREDLPTTSKINQDYAIINFNIIFKS